MSGRHSLIEREWVGSEMAAAGSKGSWTMVEGTGAVDAMWSLSISTLDVQVMLQQSSTYPAYQGHMLGA